MRGRREKRRYWQTDAIGYQGGLRKVKKRTHRPFGRRRFLASRGHHAGGLTESREQRVDSSKRLSGYAAAQDRDLSGAANSAAEQALRVGPPPGDLTSAAPGGTSAVACCPRTDRRR